MVDAVTRAPKGQKGEERLHFKSFEVTLAERLIAEYFTEVLMGVGMTEVSTNL